MPGNQTSDGNFVVAVRDLSPPPFDQIIGEASVFDVTSRKLLARFPVRYDTGGRRLAVSASHRMIFVGCYNVHGLGAYSFDGKELWRRRDLKGVQRVHYLPQVDAVFCGREGAGYVISALTGKTIATPRGAKAAYSSVLGNEIMVAASAFELHQDLGKAKWKVQRKSKWSDMDCAFSRDAAVTSECGGLLRCFNLHDGGLRWQINALGEGHWLQFTYAPRMDLFIGVRRSLKISELDCRLTHFSPQSGQIERELPLPASAVGGCFCLLGEALFVEDFTLISTTTGEIMHSLNPTGAADMNAH